MICDEKSLEQQTLFYGHQEVSRAGSFAVVTRDHATQGETGEGPRTCKSGIQVVASNIVEISIDAIRGKVTQGLGQVAYAFVIDDMLDTDASVGVPVSAEIRKFAMRVNSCVVVSIESRIARA
jgi:hypothetical protein